jgi:hypothetical protein
MPDIINNVINGIYPSSGHSIYVCELAPFTQTNLYLLQQKSFGGYRVVKNLVGSRSHFWDLYLLAIYMTNSASHISGNFKYKRFSSDYKPLYCSNFTDNAGENIYQPIPNFSGLSVLNHPVFSQYQYSGSFSFNPILSTNVNQQYAAENVIYRASVIPLFPLIFCSSIPTHKSFGPAFISSFNIKADGMNQLGDVDISCSLVGGRSIISPDNVTTYRPYLNDNYIKMKTLNEQDNQSNTVEFNNFQDKYRSINLSDCAYYPALFTGSDAFRNFGKAVQSAYSPNQMPIHKIVSMSLSIQQSVDFAYTYPGYSIGTNLPIEFGDIVGPRFASLSSRRVTGSIKLFSPQNYSFIDTNASSLTMYFGSVFFYSMKNVDWQQPRVTIDPGVGYFIEYNFAARMTEFTAFNGLLNYRVSEFL